MAGFAFTSPVVQASSSQSAASPKLTLPTGKRALPRRQRLHLRLILIALCASSALASTVALADDRRSGQPQIVAGVPSDQAVEALLRQIQQLIIVGLTLEPKDDNAWLAWARLLEVASPPSPAIQRALADFAADMQHRSVEADAAGKPEVATKFLVVADMATELRQRQSTEPPSSLAAAPLPAPSAAIPDTLTSTSTIDTRAEGSPFRDTQSAVPAEPWRTQIYQTQAQVPPARSANASDPFAVLSAPNKVATTPFSAAGNTGAASATLPPTPRPSVTTKPSQEQTTAVMFASRGDAMLAIKDISAARVFYEYAANAGSARAALALAETYDPTFLIRLGALGPRPNPVIAVDWYRKAAALGDRSAEAKLRALEVAAPK